MGETITISNPPLTPQRWVRMMQRIEDTYRRYEVPTPDRDYWAEACDRFPELLEPAEPVTIVRPGRRRP